MKSSRVHEVPSCRSPRVASESLALQRLRIIGFVGVASGQARYML